jgi:hypothetical protein
MRHTLLMTLTALALSLPSLAQSPGPAVAATAKPTAGSKLLPGTRSNVLSTIEGKATNANNVPLPDTLVRLRDARRGGIVDSTVTDKQGVFVFRDIDPGNYVIEVLDQTKKVIATSAILNVGTGDAISAVVTVPYRVPAFGGLLGSSASTGATIATAVQAVTVAAVASNAIAQTLSGAPATSTSITNGR